MNNKINNIISKVFEQSGILLESSIIPDSNYRLHVQFRDADLLKGTGYTLSFKLHNARVKLDFEFESVAKKILMGSFSMIKSNLKEIQRFTESNEFISSFDIFINNTKIDINEIISLDESLLNDLKIELYSGLIDLYDVEYVFSRVFELAIPILLLIFPYREEENGEVEGQIQEVVSNRFERSKKNRTLCLSYYGYDCQGCKVNLKESYGSIADRFIHVHHLTPISSGGITLINPIKDLIPLCPNCHSIVHRKDPPLTINELKNLLDGE